MAELDKTRLQKFAEAIDQFYSLPESKKFLFFAYYLQAEEGLDNFCPIHIKQCYEVLDLPGHSNISVLISKARDDKKLIVRGNGYRLSGPEAVNIRKMLENKEFEPNTQRFEKVYKPGEIYDFYTDVKTITSSATSEVFIIDGYANEDVIDLYLSKLPSSVKMRILTNNHQGNFLNVATKFKLKHPSNFVVKTNDKCHDRLFFVDKKCYVVGQSIDKAAKDKPTYLIGVVNSGLFRQVFQLLFDNGKTLI